MRLVQCSSNFSEGRRAEVIEALLAAVADAGSVKVTSVAPDPDHNRTVITFTGEAEACADAAVSGALAAMRLIDLNEHRGSYPRMGACDVLPFMPLAGATLEDCLALAQDVGERLAGAGLPVYFYGGAARQPGRQTVAAVRGEGFEALRSRAADDPAHGPDLGGPELHPTAGAVAIGVRMPAVMLAVTLEGNALELALGNQTAPGQVLGLPGVTLQGMDRVGDTHVEAVFALADYRQTPLHVFFAALEQAAAGRGARVAGCELLGEAPVEALLAVARHHLRLGRLQTDQVVELGLLE